MEKEHFYIIQNAFKILQIVLVILNAVVNAWVSDIKGLYCFGSWNPSLSQYSL